MSHYLSAVANKKIHLNIDKELFLDAAECMDASEKQDYRTTIKEVKLKSMDERVEKEVSHRVMESRKKRDPEAGTPHAYKSLKPREDRLRYLHRGDLHGNSSDTSCML